VPVPAPPASAPGSLAGTNEDGNIVLNWSPVSGAVGYIISRATSPGGPFNYVMSITETTYTDADLATNISYYYKIEAVNAGGVSSNATLTVPGALSVIALTSPSITGFQLAGANLTITGSGGVSNWLYYIEATTNLAAARWTPVATNQFNAAGNFSATITNAIQSNQPQTFFRLQLQ
jgi:hypothetical protein